MSIFGRIFGKSVKQVRKEAVCYVCGAPSYYKCNICGKYACMRHTASGTQTCVDCHEKAQDKGLGKLKGE